MKKIVFLSLALIAVLVGCGGCKYNDMVMKDESVKKAWSNVESQYQRRSDLIGNLVETVKGEANFEKSTLESVVNARASATQVKVDPQNLTPEKLQEFQQSQGALSQALGRLLMVTENYPTLKANDAFRNLQAELAGTENRIAVARNDFNQEVQAYNSVVRTFPTNIYANILGFKVKEGFKAEAGAEKAPKVDFGMSK